MKFYFGSAIVLAGAVAGYVTGQQALSRAGITSVEGDSHWVQAQVNNKDPYAIYAVGHFRAEGQLPPSRASLYFSRDTDDEGNSLRSSCSYEFNGTAPLARWWAFTVLPQVGSNGASTFSARDAVLSSDDGLKLAVSKHAMPGNWLALSEIGNMRVTLVLHEAYTLAKGTKLALPTLKRVTCE